MRLPLFTLSIVALAAAPLSAGDWEPKQAPLMTRWAEEVSPDNALPEYPRPQMVRDKWQNLDGLWDYAIQPKADKKPSEWDGEILVPFCAESALSGVMKRVGGDNKLWYQRSFVIPGDWQEWDVLLHFGAVDWQTTVWVNGKEVGKHEGGYDPFTFNITDNLKKGTENTITVSVWDPTDEGPQPRGKQVKNPHGIWYTPVTGIWQTVWLEPVSGGGYFESLEIVPDVDKGWVRLTANCVGARDDQIKVTVIDPTTKTVVGKQTGRPGKEIVVAIDGDVKLWSPKNPFLYDVRVSVVSGDNPLFSYDNVQSYVGMRSISVQEAPDGHQRLHLNGKPLFQYGPLDQGWWPDGLYTAPTDEALKYDIEITKKLGFNFARKHVKVEPARWYYHCDKLGLMVWQDMPNGDKHIPRGAPEDITRTAESEEIYRTEWKEIIEDFDAHPSIVCWVPFNEGWGQFKTNEILAWTKELDPTRLVDGPSGWEDRGEGDMIDMHMYPGPGMFPAEEDRATVLGEFGGLGWPVEGHLWQPKDNWGYRTYHSQEELTKHYRDLLVQVPPLIGEGLAAAIYTQTTDVEIEVNGLMTYDREVLKFPPEETRKLNQIIYGPPTKSVSVVPTSEEKAQTWKYTTKKPKKGWMKPDFDDSSWKEGKAGFGTEQTPGTHVRTTWDSSDIWLRRTIELPEKTLNAPAVRIHHDEHAQVYLNGQRIAGRRGYATGYVIVPLDEKARQVLQEGENLLAVHCRQNEGGQYIDVGIVDLVPSE